MKIVVTGGGTGGHVFPALAISEELRRRSVTVLYVGTSHGMEAKLVPEKGFPFFTVRTGAVKNQGAAKTVKTLFRLLFAILWGVRFLIKEKPDAVIGVGGYVSVPICAAAFLCRIPIYLQEQNVSVGIANRFLGRLAKVIFLGFPQAKESFAASKCIVTGNPIRPEFYRDGFPSTDPNARTVLILGGSQGAKAINDAVVSMLDRWKIKYPGLSIIHQTGVKDAERVQHAYAQVFKDNFSVSPFISDMAGAYAKASVVISRSGALTVSELIQVGRPAVFVPYPRQGQNDQTANAYWLQENGAAKVVEQGEDFPKRLEAAFEEVFVPERLGRMSESYNRLRTGGALATIGDHIMKTLAQ